ncbi:peptidase S8/S53 domain-containing protein [Syncephalis fuscata]|nr:peptidase S8/S53 domain-containing protein [Syncephalis fuscata]
MLPIYISLLATSGTLPTSTNSEQTVNSLLNNNRAIPNSSEPTLELGSVALRRRQSNNQLSGRGIKIGIIDSGIDYKHPALGGCFGPGCKVAYGYDFVGDAYDGKNNPISDEDPMDECNGHGTHVAGIIAGRSKEITGMAPDATLGAYRIFSCNNKAPPGIVMKALDRAANEMDIINLSLNQDQFFSAYGDAKKAQELVDRGIIVVASAGNIENGHLGGILSPATAPGVIAVASSDTSLRQTFYFMVGNYPAKFYYIAGTGVSMPQTMPNTIMRVKSGDSKGCDRLGSGFENAIVLLQYGGCLSTQKAKRAHDANAAGIIIINENSNLVYFTVDPAEVKIPVLLMTDKQGDSLTELMDKSSQDDRADVRWYSTPSQKPVGKSGFASFFSAYGPSDNITNIKPDISWQGNQVYSTIPRKMGSYAIQPGTSMAAPGITGLAALALQKYKASIPVTAKTMIWPKWQEAEDVAGKRGVPVAYCGSGMARVSAINELGWGTEPQTIGFSPKSVGANSVYEVELTLTGQLPPGTITFEHRPSASVADWGPGAEWDDDLASKKSVEVTISPERLDVGSPPPNANINTLRNEKFNVKLTVPQWNKDELWVLSGIIEVTHRNAATGAIMVRNVPYQTLAGTGRNIKMLDRKNNYPRLENVDANGEVIPEKSNGTPLTNKHAIRISFRLRLPSQRVFGVIEDVKSKRQLGFAQDVKADHLNASPEGPNKNYNTIWGGLVMSMPKFRKLEGKPYPVPRGTYRMRLYVSKPFGDPLNERDYESWLSEKEIKID